MKKQKVAVTGASGFLGKAICERMAADGLSVVKLSRTKRTGFNRVDYSDPDSLERVMGDVDVICHAAGLINGTLDELTAANITTTRNLIETAKRVRVKRFVLISSAAAAMLKGEYGRIKKQAEDLLIASVVNHLIFRPTLIYGVKDTKNIATMINTVRKTPVIPVLGGGRFKVQPIYIDDAVSVIVQAVKGRGDMRIYNLSGPEQISLRQMLVLICRAMNKRRLFVPVPLKPVQSLLTLYQVLFPFTKLPVKQVMELDKHEKFSNRQTILDFDFSPASFSTGLEIMVRKGGIA